MVLYFQHRAFKTHLSTASTGTVITLDAATPIDTSGAGAAGTVLAAGAMLSSAYATNSVVMKSYTIEVGHTDINQFRQYTGMVLSKMSIKLAVGAIVTGSFDFMGKGFNLLGATGNGVPNVSQTFVPANATKGVFDILENGQSITATTYIKSGEFDIDNTLRMQDAVGVFGAAGIGSGTLQIKGKLEVYFADAVIYNKLLNGAATSLTIPLLDVNGNGYIFKFPLIKYTAAKVQVGGLDQDSLLMMDWQATVDINPASPTYQKTCAIYRVGAAPSSTIVAQADTRPRFTVATSNAGLVNGTLTNAAALALLNAMTPLTGSANNGRAGTMSILTPAGAGDYGWYACLPGLGQRRRRLLPGLHRCRWLVGRGPRGSERFGCVAQPVDDPHPGHRRQRQRLVHLPDGRHQRLHQRSDGHRQLRSKRPVQLAPAHSN